MLMPSLAVANSSTDAAFSAECSVSRAQQKKNCVVRACGDAEGFADASAADAIVATRDEKQIAI
jgi:hypothetical protein